MERRAALIVGLASIAALVRALAACLRPPWHDEYYTVWAARLPLPELLAALRLDSGPPLPYVLVRLVAAPGLPPLAAARLVSLVAGTAAVLLAAKAARAALGEREALFCGVLFALHPLAVALSSEGRAYGLLLLASAWAWERTEALRAHGRGASGLAAAVALGCWTHGLGPVIGVAAALAALALTQPARTRALAAVAAGLASLLPWIPVALAQPPAATAWMHAAWSAMEPVERAAAAVRLLPPLAPFGRTVDLPTFTALPSAAAAVCFLTLALGTRAPLPTLAMAAFPAVALPVLAALGMPAFYPGRAEALFLAPALAIAAGGARRFRAAGLVAAALVAAAAVASAAALLRWRQAPPSGEETVAAAVATRHPNGAVVVAAGYWWLDVRTALEPRGGAYTVLAYPACVERHPGWFDPRTCTPAPAEASALLARLTAAPERTAIVLAPGLPSERTLASLAERLSLQPSVRVPGAVLYLPRDAPPPRR